MRSKLTLAVALLLIGSAQNAHAVCVQNDSSAAEWALWNTHGCDWNFVLWADDVYDTRSSDWSNRGYYEACNIDKEFTKFWNAAYLIHYGLSDNWDWSFHGTTDYEQASWKYDSEYHDDLYHKASDDMSFVGYWQWQFWGANSVETSCRVYNATEVQGHPAARGKTYVHEGWHGWQEQHYYSTDHINGPVGNCSASGNACDYWYWHGISAFLFGEMWKWTSDGTYFHSPNQASVEYLCDLADLPQGWVPGAVLTPAASIANLLSDQRFINGPGFHCGDWRPW